MQNKNMSFKIVLELVVSAALAADLIKTNWFVCIFGCNRNLPGEAVPAAQLTTTLEFHVFTFSREGLQTADFFMNSRTPSFGTGSFGGTMS